MIGIFHVNDRFEAGTTFEASVILLEDRCVVDNIYETFVYESEGLKEQREGVLRDIRTRLAHVDKNKDGFESVFVLDNAQAEYYSYVLYRHKYPSEKMHSNLVRSEEIGAEVKSDVNSSVEVCWQIKDRLDKLGIIDCAYVDLYNNNYGLIMKQISPLCDKLGYTVELDSDNHIMVDTIDEKYSIESDHKRASVYRVYSKRKEKVNDFISIAHAVAGIAKHKANNEEQLIKKLNINWNI